MEKYINKKLYSDVISYRVFDINEKAGTAMAIEVERDFTPEWVPGGFSAICTNITDQDNAPVKDKDGAKPFAITRNKDGVWGIKCRICFSAGSAKQSEKKMCNASWLWVTALLKKTKTATKWFACTG